jgi:hypothetical protein
MIKLFVKSMIVFVASFGMMFANNLTQGLYEGVESFDLGDGTTIERDVPSLQIATVLSPGVIHWNVDMNLLKCCLIETLNSVDGCNSWCATNIKNVTINYSSVNNSYYLNYVGVCCCSFLFAETLALKEKNGVLYVCETVYDDGLMQAAPVVVVIGVKLGKVFLNKHFANLLVTTAHATLGYVRSCKD